MEKQTKLKHPTLPIYLSGLVYVIYTIFLPFYRPIDIGIALVVSASAYFLLRMRYSGKVIGSEAAGGILEAPGDNDAAEIAALGRSYMARLRKIGTQITDEEIYEDINNLLDISKQIFDTILKYPPLARKTSTFMDYYYPKALKLLENYAELSKSSTKTQNIDATLKKISGSLDNIKVAFEHQLDILYSDKAMDITTDIAVLEGMLMREGISKGDADEE